MPCPDGRFTDRNCRCEPGSRRVAFEEWRADPTSEARKDPKEICTVRNGRVYQRGKGPHPPAHYGCRCERRFVYYRCVPVTTK